MPDSLRSERPRQLTVQVVRSCSRQLGPNQPRSALNPEEATVPVMHICSRHLAKTGYKKGIRNGF